MPAQILLAPAGGGKTAHAVSRVRELRGRAPFAPIWVVLPNFPQVSAFRRRMACAGGALGVEVGTFYRFYADVLACAGIPVPRLFDPVQHRLLRGIVDRLCEQGHLQHYAPLRDKPGFIRALRALIQELKQARVRREDLAAAVADQPPRIAELSTVYADYQEWLVESGWTDAEGQGWLAARALEHNPALYADLALLVVDGFDEFNPTQLEVLRLLADRVGETLITITGDAASSLPRDSGEIGGRPRTAHRRFVRALSALGAAVRAEPVSFSDHHWEGRGDGGTRGRGDEPLAHLEASLFEPNPVLRPGDDAVEFIEARDRRQEVRAALRWLKARVVQDGMSPQDVALLARNLDPYRSFLEEIAAGFGLPLQVAVGSDLASNPAVAALLSLVSLPVLDWPRRPVIETLASPYFDWSVLFGEELPDSPAPSGERQEEGAIAARLDAIARARLVIQGLDQWREALDWRVGAAPEPASGEDVGAGPAGEEEGAVSSDKPTGEDVAALRQAFDRIVERLTPRPQATIRDYVAWVEGLIGDDPELVHPSAAATDEGSLHIVAQARKVEGGSGGCSFAQRDVAALQALKDVLRGLVLSESLLAPASQAGDEVGNEVPYARFFLELRSAVEAATYAPPRPETGCILVAPVLGARGLSFRAVALLGLSEGEFPAAGREDPLLREADRALMRARGLPLEPRLRSEEATLFYEAVTRARERLLLCRPYLADDGQTWEPSPYWHHLRRLVDAPLCRVRAEEVPLDEAASLQEFLTAASLAGASPTIDESDGGSGGREWQAVLAGAEVVRARLARLPVGSRHEGDLRSLAPLLSARFGPEHIWSSSRLETYAKCPLHFYVAHVLHLKPRKLPQEGFDRLILGSIYHLVLEKVYQLAPDDPLSVLHKVAAEVFKGAPEKYDFRPTALWEQQQREFLRVLERTVVALEEAREGYEPFEQELPFGLKEKPPLVINRPPTGTEPSASSIQIRGYIDRVDRAPDRALRVIDYKAGSSRISARELEEGTRLQLPLYAMAVRDAWGLEPVVDGFYWHIGSASPSYLRLGRCEGGVDGAIEQSVGYVRAYVAAVREGRFVPTPPAGGCPDHCPAVGFCWRYVPRGW